ncbi:MAG: hypothetical protein ACFFCP_12615 [Promethearchaeota archaeon]
MKRILESIQSLPLTTREFQETQTKLSHHNVLNYVPIGCAYEDGLAELLTDVRLGVVLDKHTSWSRTTWLAGALKDAPLLIVLDTVNSDGVNRASMDIWTNIDDIPDELFRNLQMSRMGSVPDLFSSLEISWNIDNSGGRYRLILTLSGTENVNSIGSGEIFFTVDYQNFLSETFKSTFPLKQEQVSISIDLGNVKSVWSDSLEQSFLAIYITDSEWKSSDRSHEIRYSWRDALVRQIERYLETGKRLTSFQEISASLNLEDNQDAQNAKKLFFSFCLDSVVEGCKSQRVSDHCRRCVVLSGLVICFNPKRGLSGYLEMVLQGPKELSQLGSERTWRDHLSHIVNAAHDFKPVQVEFKEKRKARGPGRPPTQLLPTIPPLKLFRDFIQNPESVVCRYCRFSNESE